MTNVNPLDSLVLLARHRDFFVRFVLGTVALAAIVVFLILPRSYKSTAVVMPPKQKNIFGLLSAFARPTSSSLRSLGLGGTSDDLAQFQTILMSRRVLEMVVNEFRLMEVYDLDTMEKAIKELSGNCEVSPGEEDVSVEIVVYDEDTRRAADMANFFVRALNDVYLDMSVGEARSNREFLEARYTQNLSDLHAAEERFKEFQQKHRVYSVPDQVKAAVEAAAEIQSQIMLREVQLGILKHSVSSEDPSRQAVEQELAELRKQLTGMRYGGGSGARESGIFTPFQEAPAVAIEYFRHYREVEIQGKLLELLMPLYEQARIEEKRNTPSVVVLDTAVPAVKAARPKRLILMIVITLLAGLLGVAIVFFKDYLDRAIVAGETRDKLALIRKEFHWRALFRRGTM